VTYTETLNLKVTLLELPARELASMFAMFPELYTALKNNALEAVRRASHISLRYAEGALYHL